MHLTLRAQKISDRKSLLIHTDRRKKLVVALVYELPSDTRLDAFVQSTPRFIRALDVGRTERIDQSFELTGYAMVNAIGTDNLVVCRGSIQGIIGFCEAELSTARTDLEIKRSRDTVTIDEVTDRVDKT
jgi:hypothetical protein